MLLKKKEERATGLLFSTISLSHATGPFLGGLVAQYWGYHALMYLASGFCVSGLAIARVKAK